MDDIKVWLDVIVLAAIAGFVAWRLFSVLGSRTGHEPPPVNRGQMADEVHDVFARPRQARTQSKVPAEPKTFDLPDTMNPALKQQLRDISALDSSFEPTRFLAGAQAAYGFILNLFWQGDTESLRPYLGDDVHFAFAQAINTRPGAKTVIDSKLEAITSAELVSAELVGASAHITVRFVATIVTDGVAGTATDDWVFSRHTRSSDPNWLLIATDDSVGA
jgi:predicted lipid-binding transport protein (Tim44 family)